MRRFFFHPEERTGDRVLLSETESRHMKTVLRLKAGDCIELLDGFGGVYAASVVTMDKRVIAEIISVVSVDSNEKTALWVGQGMLKSKKMDSVVQKCTELGAERFIPFISNRCQGRPDVRQIQKKHERWNRIIEESCKQCFRPRPMELVEPVPFHEAAMSNSEERNELKLLFWEEEHTIRIENLPPLTEYDRICIMLGPEGGITHDEIELARSKEWQTVSLGSRILRAETATFASVSIIQHLLGNM